MTIGQALLWATKNLKKSSKRDGGSALDAEVLLSFASGKRREALLTHPEKYLTARQFAKFKNLIARRRRHEPIAYIIGKKGFFGLKFKVNPSVLIPRPETELLVEEAIKSYKLKAVSYKLILDIGTGSGAIAVTLARNLPSAKIIATDVSAKALKIAKQNAKNNGVGKRIKFVKTSLLPNLKAHSLRPTALIVANLPYLPARVWQKAMPDVKKFEPKGALLGGADGLDLIKKLLQEIKSENIKGTVLLEIDPSQKTKLPKIIKTIFPTALVETKKDLAGLFRIVKIILI